MCPSPVPPVTMTSSDVDNSQQATLRLDDRSYVITLLNKLVQHRVLVSVTLSDQPQVYTSTLLLVDADKNTLLLDEIFPAVGRRHLLEAKSCHLHARVEGATLNTELSFIEAVKDNVLIYYLFEFPEVVEYTQRREGHRVRVDSLNVVAEIYSANGMAYKGILHDFSPGGVSLELDEGSDFRNTEIYRCTLYPPHETPFHCKLEICCRRHDAPRKKVILGGSFVELDRRGEHAVNKLVTELERQLLRSRRMPQGEKEGL